MQTQTLIPARQAIYEAIAPFGIVSERKMHRKNAEMMEKVNHVTKALSLVAPVHTPDVPAVHSPEDVDANAQLISEKVAEQLIGDTVGRAIVVPQGLQCTFFDNLKEFGILNHTHKTIRHVHVIANPKYRRYPFHGDIPPKGQKIIDTLCEAGLERQIRIVTGDLIQEDVRKVAEYQKRTALGSFFDSSSAAVIAGTAATGAALLATGAAIENGADIAISGALKGMAALVAAPFIFLADPCVLIGDVCFYGWK